MGEGRLMDDFKSQAMPVLNVHDAAETPTPSSLSFRDASRDIMANDIGTSEDDLADELDEDSFRQDAQLRVGAIIGRVTHQLEGISDDRSQMQEPPEPSQASATAATAELVKAVACSTPKQQASPTRPKPPPMGTGAVPNKQRGDDIAKILKASRGPAEIRRYAERVGFGRRPGHMREVATSLDAEQQYILSLHEQKEDGPKALVRVLEEGEKAKIIQALRMQFQQVSAHALKAKPRSKARSDLEVALERIRQDMDNLSRPYIFVEVKAAAK